MLLGNKSEGKAATGKILEGFCKQRDGSEKRRVLRRLKWNVPFSLERDPPELMLGPKPTSSVNESQFSHPVSANNPKPKLLCLVVPTTLVWPNGYRVMSRPLHYRPPTPDLRDELKTLESYCIVSKVWIYHKRKHIFESSISSASLSAGVE